MAAEPTQSETRQIEAVLDWLDKRRQHSERLRQGRYLGRFVRLYENPLVQDLLSYHEVL